jgi:1-acyl-sn-glycerol-3-phosphate acyltransferase
MKVIITILKAIYTIYVALLFVIFLFVIFPLVIIASFFGKIKGGNFIYHLCILWTDYLFFLSGIFTKKIIESPIDKNKQYVFVFNHISYLDIPIIMKALRGIHFRVLGKAEMSKIPIFGFLYRNAVVSVDRSSATNRAKSVLQLKAVLRKDISVVISPEGTFNMTGKPLKEFYDGAFKVAIETQTPIKPLLFLDAFDRMNYHDKLLLTPGKCRIVYIEEIAVDGLTINDVQLLKEKVYKKMEEGLIKYKANWIGYNRRGTETES